MSSQPHHAAPIHSTTHEGRTMKRVLVSAAAIVAAIGFIAPANATGVAKGTTEGPYGPVAFQDYGTCTNIWADVNLKTTYTVPARSDDGSYLVTFKLAGPFTSIAGQAPGACGTTGTDNGDTIKDGIKGKMTQTFHLIVTGGKFKPKATCDDSCATDYTWNGVNTFVSTFFKTGAAWSFSATELTHQVVTTTSKQACKDKWTVDYDPSSGTISKSKGDIATSC
jgi:hypothetical protein